MNDVLALLACLGVMCGASGLAYRWIAHWQQPRIPAAPDNQPGRDVGLYLACRRIDRQPTHQPRKEKP